MIEYKSNTGYRGILYGKSSMSIYAEDGHEVMHTGSRNVNTLEELKDIVEGYPGFRKILMEHWDEIKEDDDEYEI